MSENSVKNKVFTNMIWRFLERCGAQIVAFVVSIILARLLEPEVYGTVALVTVINSVLQVFVDSGMANALIQKKDADNIDFSTVFFFNVVICVVLYIGMYFAAPYIAKFYDIPELTAIVRVLSLTLIISGIKNVQQAYVSKKLIFKRFFYSTLAGTIASAVVGILMAYNGFGVWALVAQYVVNSLMSTLVLWITVKWHPILKFSFGRLKTLFSFGWKLLVSALIETIYSNIRQLIIGKMYSSEDLAFYNKGKTFPDLVINNVNVSIDSVLLPVMSNEQDNVEKVKSMTRRSIKMSVYIVAPIMIGLAVVAPTFISLVLTDKWLPCVPFLQIFCIIYMFYPIHTANLNAIKAMGRSDMFLKLEIIKKIVGVALLVVSMPYGVMAMTYSLLINCFCSQIINSWPNIKLLKYGYIQQLMDIIPSILLAIVMGLCIYAVGFLNLSHIVKLLVQVILGMAVYIGGSILLKIDIFYYVLDILKSFLKRN